MKEKYLLELVIQKIFGACESYDCDNIAKELHRNDLMEKQRYRQIKKLRDTFDKNILIIKTLRVRIFNTLHFQKMLKAFYVDHCELADDAKLVYCILKHEDDISRTLSYQKLFDTLKRQIFFVSFEEKKLLTLSKDAKHILDILKDKEIEYFRTFFSCLKQLNEKNLVTSVVELSASVFPYACSTIDHFQDFLKKRYTNSTFKGDDRPINTLHHPVSDDVDLTLTKLPNSKDHTEYKEESTFFEEYNKRLEDSNSTCPKLCSYSEIFAKDCRLILIQGYPGSGKTTLAKRLCTLWAKGHLLHEFTHVFFLQLRNSEIANAKSIKHLIEIHMGSLSKNITTDIESKCGKGLLVILEGWDELPKEKQESSIHTRLIRGEVLPDAVVLITSRSSAIHKIPKNPNQWIEILGFTKQQVQQFTHGYLKKYGNEEHLVTKFSDELQRIPLLECLLFIPINLNIALYVFVNQNYHLPSTLTYMYERLVVLQLNNRHDVPINNLKGLCTSGEVYATLIGLGKMAYVNLQKDNVILNFNEHMIQKYCFNSSDQNLANFDGMGLLQVTNHCYYESSVKTYEFIHKTIQELLASWFLSQQPVWFQVKELRKMFNIKEFEMVWLFYAGLTKFETVSFAKLLPRSYSQRFYYHSLSSLISFGLPHMFRFTGIKKVISDYFSRKQYSKGISNVISREFQITLVAAVMEAQNPYFCKDMCNSYLFYGDNCWFYILDSDITPQMLLSLSYCIAHSGKKWMIQCKTLDTYGTENLLKYLTCNNNAESSIYTFNVTCSQSQIHGIIEVVKTQNCLQWLILSRCEQVDDDFINDLTAALAQNSCVKMLHLLGCKLNHTSVKAIANMLKTNQTLEWIGLKQNLENMTENDVVVMLLAIRHSFNSTIYMLMLDKVFHESARVQIELQKINEKRHNNKKLCLTTIDCFKRHDYWLVQRAISKSSQNIVPGSITTGDGKNVNFGEYSVKIVCPNCKEETVTKTNLQHGSLVWAMIMVILLIPLLWPLIFLPYCCADQAKDTCHSCSHCNEKLGIYEML